MTNYDPDLLAALRSTRVRPAAQQDLSKAIANATGLRHQTEEAATLRPSVCPGSGAMILYGQSYICGTCGARGVLDMDAEGGSGRRVPEHLPLEAKP